MSLLADFLYCYSLIPHYYYHLWRTDKYGPDASQKLGRIPTRTSEKKCVWFHAVSVGEAIAAKTLIKGFEEAYPDWDIVISTTTATGREVAQKNYGAERVVYFPLDCSWMVHRAFDAIRPDLILLMELEVWPNFSEIAAKRNVPVVVVNARITEKSVRGFTKWGFLLKPMLQRVRLWCSQSEVYSERLRTVGVDPARIETVGSTKYDTIPTEIDPALRARYRALFGVEEGARLLVAGSTHPTEETAVLAAFTALQSDYPDLRLVLVPRHPERHDAVAAEAEAVAPLTRRSAIAEGASASTPIILLDTMGELAAVYAAADVVFVGGSLIAHGGQNIMEPCGLGCPTVVGPSLYNFEEASQLLLQNNGMRRITGAAELTDAVRAILSDPVGATEMGQNARTLLMKQQGATARTIKRLEPIINGT